VPKSIINPFICFDRTQTWDRQDRTGPWHILHYALHVSRCKNAFSCIQRLYFWRNTIILCQKVCFPLIYVKFCLFCYSLLKNLVFQTWTGHCATVPWHGAPFDEHRRPFEKIKIINSQSYLITLNVFVMTKTRQCCSL